MLALYPKLIEAPKMTQVGDVPTPNNKVNITTPLPLVDLHTIIEGMNQYNKTGKDPEQFEHLGQGHFGSVFGYKGYAIKKVHGGQDSYRRYDMADETNEILDAFILRQLQNVPAIPRLYGVIDNEIIIMEKIDGMTLRQYQRQMDDPDKMDNFIHTDYIKMHKEIMIDILMEGFIPRDMHMDNVMIDKETGQPRIIDVGLFEKMRDRHLRLRGDVREDIFVEDFWQVNDAVGYAKQMKKYIQERKFPQLLEERRAELIEEKEQRERYKEVVNKREELEKQRRAEKERQREEERKAKIEAYKERGEDYRHLKSRDLRKGFIDWNNIPVNRGGVPKTLFGIHGKIHDIGFMRVEHFKPFPDIDADFNKVPENAQELIEMKKNNRFKNNLHNMFKNDRKQAINNKHQFGAIKI